MGLPRRCAEAAVSASLPWHVNLNLRAANLCHHAGEESFRNVGSCGEQKAKKMNAEIL